MKITLFWASMVLCGTAMADLSETTILKTSAALNLETGAVVGSGGDILWDGSTIAPQAGAKAGNIGLLGVTNFAGLPPSYFAPQATAATAMPIAAKFLTPGDAFVVVTNTGKIAKVLVMENSVGSITLQFTVFGISAPAGVPLIVQVVNNASYIPVGFPGFAQQSPFALKVGFLPKKSGGGARLLAQKCGRYPAILPVFKPRFHGHVRELSVLRGWSNSGAFY